MVGKSTNKMNKTNLINHFKTICFAYFDKNESRASGEIEIAKVISEGDVCQLCSFRLFLTLYFL